MNVALGGQNGLPTSLFDPGIIDPHQFGCQRGGIVPPFVSQDCLAVLIGENRVGEGSTGDPGLRCQFGQDSPMFLSVGEVEVDLGDVEFVKRSSHVRNLQGPGATGVSWTRAMLLKPGRGQ